MNERTGSSGDRIRSVGNRHGTDADGGRDTSSTPSVVDPERSSITGRSHPVDQHDDGDVSAARSTALVATLRFVYRHSTALVPTSVLWAILSLPLFTVGPATLGLYATVCSLRETGRVDRDRVVTTVRDNFAAATMLGFVPFTFIGIAILYVASGLATGTLGIVMTVGSLYAGLYVGVLLIPTFVAVAAGVEPRTALRDAYLWIAGSPAIGIQLLLVTLVVFVASLALTIGFVLLFAGLAGAYHVEIVARAANEDTGTLEHTASTLT